MWRVFTLRPFKLDCNSTALLPTAIAPPANLILSKVAMPAFKLCRHRGPSPATIAAWALLISSFSAAVSSAAEVDAAKLPPAADRKVDFAHDIQPLLTPLASSKLGAPLNSRFVQNSMNTERLLGARLS